MTNKITIPQAIALRPDTNQANWSMWCRKGIIPAEKIGNMWFISMTEADVLAFNQSRHDARTAKGAKGVVFRGDKYVGVAEAARLMDCSKQTVYARAGRGEIVRVKDGRRQWFKVKSITG